MSETSENLPAPVQTGELARRYPVMDPEIFNEIKRTVDANIGPGGLDEQQLEKIKIPAGGATMWLVAGLEGEDSLKELAGIIVAWRDIRLYWRIPYAERGKHKAPPDCTSKDGIWGEGDPGGYCNKCPLAKFGSDPKAKRGQACKQVRQLLLLRDGRDLPEVVNIPPTSHKSVQTYFLRLGSYRIPYWGLVTHMKLEKTQNLDGVDYARVLFTAGMRMSEAERRVFEPYQQLMMSLIKPLEVETDDYVVVDDQQPRDEDAPR